jgi:putative hydrolases of HD superfamily
MKNINKNIINFLFEACTLKRLKRTGWQILGGGNEESIAEHSYMVAVFSYILAEKLKAKIEKVLIMALFHDFSETRTGDIYKLADLYVKADENKADRDSFGQLPKEYKSKPLIEKYKSYNTLESKIVHDADNLALIIELKLLIENGNENAKEWLRANMERLKLPESKILGEEISKSNSQDWWKIEREVIHKSYKK